MPENDFWIMRALLPELQEEAAEALDELMTLPEVGQAVQTEQITVDGLHKVAVNEESLSHQQALKSPGVGDRWVSSTLYGAPGRT